MKEKKRRSISGKITIALVVFAILLVVSTCLAMIKAYQADMTERYSDQVTAYAEAAAEFIDGDTIATYLATQEKDDYYEEVQHFLNSFLNNTDIEYYYVFVPTDEGLMYIWDGNVDGSTTAIGELEEYVEGGHETALAAFSKDPEIVPLISNEDFGYIATVLAPVYDSAGEPVALVGVDISMHGVQETIIDFIFKVSVAIVGVVVLFTIFLLLYVNRKMVKPIRILNKASRQMVDNLENDLDVAIDIHTADEIEDLARSFETMNTEVKSFIHQLAKATAEKERIGAELDVATKIQTAMLPSIFPAFPDREDFDIFASTHPAKEVGGDFYDFFFVDDNHLAIVMADVSGKGVPAALFMVIAKTLLKNRCQLSNETPAESLAFVNNQLCENNEEMMFVTVWLGILDLTTGLMTASNAGHEFPVFKKKNGFFELIEDQHGFVLAGMEDSPYSNYQIQFEPGDTLYLYTDGVPEATDADEAFYGMERMVEALNRADSHSCKAIVTAMTADIDAFVAGSDQYDDVTQLAFTYFGPQ